MHNIQQPHIFETLYSSSYAIKDWKHWFATFENFPQNVEQYARDRRTLLLNFIGFSVYELMFDCQDYERAVSKVQQLYEKPKNEIHVRYILLTRREKPRRDAGRISSKSEALKRGL